MHRVVEIEASGRKCGFLHSFRPELARKDEAQGNQLVISFNVAALLKEV